MRRAGSNDPPNSAKPVSFIAYIDEAGDDGLKRVRPMDPTGSSEWFVLSAVLVSAEHEKEVLPWVKELVTQIKQHQRRDIHFSHLRADKRIMVCEALSQLPVRCFAVVSNKKNMQGHRNSRAEKIPSKNWFYCWMLRLLLERVTDYCERRSTRVSPSNGVVRIEFSRRGGMSYSQFRAYLAYIRRQSSVGRLYLNTGDIKWDYIDEHRIFTYDHRERAGLQLADVVASAFYQAATGKSGDESDIAPAKTLAPRMCVARNGTVFNYGLKFMPAYYKAQLTPVQKRIFEFYKRENRQAPGPNCTAGNTSQPSGG
ncbi:MAG: DUF3800 domain-containing protein [Ferrovibrio sp.]